MNYLSKPITGLTTKISQLFSGRVKIITVLHPGWTEATRQIQLTCTFNYY